MSEEDEYQYISRCCLLIYVLHCWMHIRLSPIGESRQSILAKVQWNLANWRKSRGYIGESHRSLLAKVHCTFANIPRWLSPIGESPLEFRQYTPVTFANWRESTGISPIYPGDFRQLVRVWCEFNSVTCRLENIRLYRSHVFHVSFQIIVVEEMPVTTRDAALWSQANETTTLTVNETYWSQRQGLCLIRLPLSLILLAILFVVEKKAKKEE